jgi:Lhr-like helicase
LYFSYILIISFAIINRDRIHSIGELEGKIEKLKYEYEKARVEVNILTSKQEHLNDILEQSELFFSLSDKSTLSGSEQLKLNISRQAMKNNNICDRSDYEHLKSIQQETDKKIAVLKDNFKDCKLLYEVYADIAKTYYDISKGITFLGLLRKNGNDVMLIDILLYNAQYETLISKATQLVAQFL